MRSGARYSLCSLCAILSTHCTAVPSSHADSVRREAKEILQGWLRDGTIEGSSRSPQHSTSSAPQLPRDQHDAPTERSLAAGSDTVSGAPRDFGDIASTISASKILRRRSEEREGKRRRAQEEEAKRFRLETRQVLRSRFLLVIRCTSEAQDTGERRLAVGERAGRAPTALGS
jgi:hypothetical protein